jgi:NAD(P)-dependent dehydrogenase (short-subunit alcohol dehydrogenase family)
MGLYGKRLLVVGGGSGIGYAVAELALQHGAQVVIASSRAERIAAAAERLGRGVSARRMDLTDEASVAGFFTEAGSFDHVVTTAGDWAANGGGFRTPLAELDIAAAEASFRVRYWGALTLAKHAAKALGPAGSLTLTGGMVAHRPSKGACVATSVAGAIEHLTRGLAVELAPLRVNAVVPGLIRTGIWDRIPEAHREQTLSQMTSKLLVPRIGEADEAARAYLYLMECGYVTGQCLYVEGGSR